MTKMYSPSCPKSAGICFSPIISLFWTTFSPSLSQLPFSLSPALCPLGLLEKYCGTRLCGDPSFTSFGLNAGITVATKLTGRRVQCSAKSGGCLRPVFLSTLCVPVCHKCAFYWVDLDMKACSYLMMSMCPFLAARWRGDVPLGSVVSPFLGSSKAAHMLLDSSNWTTYTHTSKTLVHSCTVHWLNFLLIS